LSILGSDSNFEGRFAQLFPTMAEVPPVPEPSAAAADAPAAGMEQATSGYKQNRTNPSAQKQFSFGK